MKRSRPGPDVFDVYAGHCTWAEYQQMHQFYDLSFIYKLRRDPRF